VRKALLDTNILSYFFRGNPLVIEKLRQYNQFYDRLSFSLLTYYELKGGLRYRDARNLLTRFHELAQESEILLLTRDTMDIASDIYVDLRTRGLLIAPMDLFIAACAIEHDYLLVTANVRHFQNIAGLSYENWADENITST
jgi:tRNA(fMet)-specific endonuclease VapC